MNSVSDFFQRLRQKPPTLNDRARELEEKAEDARSKEEAKNELIALLEHELRNPLASLLSATELMTLTELPREEQKKLLGTMCQRIRAMTHILEISLTKNPPRLPATAQQVVPQKNTGSGLKVLVVDDNQDAAQSLGRLLELRGHRVALTYDGAGALSGATLDEPHVIILDIGLPDTDGYTVARGLRERKVGSTLIALSGYGQAEDKEKAMAAGFDFHLTKPIGLADLEPLLLQVVR